MNGKLENLRHELDRIDAQIHELLIARSVISCQVGKRKRGGLLPAFRPARERDMTALLRDRHHGALPLASLEHIWREIITTSTAVQAPFSVHVGRGNHPDIRDLARYMFGFSVPFVVYPDDDGAVAAVRNRPSDLALVALLKDAVTPWWRHLDAHARDGLRIVARIPFLDTDDRPVVASGFIISHPLSATEPVECLGDAHYWSMQGSRLPDALARAGGEVIQFASSDAGPQMLLSLSAQWTRDDLIHRMCAHRKESLSFRHVGGAWLLEGRNKDKSMNDKQHKDAP